MPWQWCSHTWSGTCLHCLLPLAASPFRSPAELDGEPPLEAAEPDSLASGVAKPKSTTQPRAAQGVGPSTPSRASNGPSESGHPMGAPLASASDRDRDQNQQRTNPRTNGQAQPGAVPGVQESAGTGSGGSGAGASIGSSIGPGAEEGFVAPLTLRVFSFEDLRAATQNFRRDSKLGEGGFGSVYRGWVPDDTGAAVEDVAVKILNPQGLQGHKEWKVQSCTCTNLYLSVEHLKHCTMLEACDAGIAQCLWWTCCGPQDPFHTAIGALHSRMYACVCAVP